MMEVSIKGLLHHKVSYSLTPMLFQPHKNFFRHRNTIKDILNKNGRLVTVPLQTAK